MTSLSPQAQAVLDAAFTLADNLDRDVTEAEMIAATLRAAADQVDHDWSGFNCVDALCEIAAELEGAGVGCSVCHSHRC